MEKVNMWRYYDDERIYFDTIVFVSEDENFTTEDIVYNSDADNFFGFGAGTDEEYAESAEGKEITFEPRNARYIRVLNNGNDRPWKKGGHYIEIEAWALVEKEAVAMEHSDDPLDVPSFTANGKVDGVTHPDVVKFDEPWNGYSYWMAVTPNQNGNSQFENPCLAASNDGQSWVVPDEAMIGQLGEACAPDTEEPEQLIIDNADIQFEGEWKAYNDSSAYGGSACFSNKPDAYAEFKFVGTAFSWFGQKDSNFNLGNIYVDGEYVGIGNGNSVGSNPYQECYAEVAGLSNEEHTVRIYPNGPAEWLPNGSENNLIDVDFVTYSSEEMEVSPDNIYTTEEKLKIKTGESREITMFPTNDNTFITGYKYSYEIEDPEIASVSSGESGNIYKVTGKAVGETVLTVMVVGTEIKKEIPIQIKSDQLPEKRMNISNEEPLLLVPVYGQVYHDEESELAWNDTLLGRWNQVPDSIKSNVVMEIHLGGLIGLGGDREDAKRFYKQQLEIADKNNIPVMIVTATAGLEPQYTATNILDNEWLENMLEEYECLKGFMITENYWTNYNAVAARTADYLRIAAENGAYVIWSEHETHVIENVLKNTAFSEALETYKDNFIFTWKNTPVTQNAGTASYMQGLWLSGVIDQWGGLADTWKWWEKGYWRLFDETPAPYAGTRSEECRAVVSEPEALLGIEMLSIYNNGGSVYNFEHPGYVFGCNDVNSPAFTNVVAETFLYIMENPAPSKEDVLAETKAVVHGDISRYANDLHVGLTTNDESLPTNTTGRYGLIPSVPSSIDSDKIAEAIGGSDKIADLNDSQFATREERVKFFNSLYPENYTGSAFAQKVNDSWVIYNSNVNVNVNQDAEISLADKKVNVNVTPHTFAILSQDNNGISVYMNNYRVDKDSIWENYSNDSVKWNTDINDLMQNWVTNEYSMNPADGEYRKTVFSISGLSQKPFVKVNEAMEDSYDELSIEYDETTDVAVVTVNSNGYIDFNIQVVDKSKLEAAYDKYSKYENDGYTAESWEKFAASLETAEAVLNDDDADQQKVDDALNDLEDKAGKLKKVQDVETVKPGKEPVQGADKLNQKDDAPKTGDATGLYGAIFMLISAFVVIIIFAVKKISSKRH